MRRDRSRVPTNTPPSLPETRMPSQSPMTRLVVLAAASALLGSTARAQQPAPLPIFYKLGQVEAFNDVVVSPNGRLVLRVMDSGVDVVATATGRVVHLSDGSAGDAAWGASGDRIVWSRWEGEPRLPTVWTVAVDPLTGARTGNPQRVSIGIGHTPTLSFDGKLIAYSTVADTGATNLRNPARRIVVVPTLGGPERTIARTARSIDGLYWSRDGKTLYAAGGSPDTSLAALTRISVADGTVRVLSRLPGWMAGVSSDRRVFALMPYGITAAPGAVITLVDSAGRTIGTVPLRFGQRIYSAGLLRDSAVVMMEFEDNWGLEIRNVAGGGARSLPIIGTASLAPKWSPDGRRIAFSVERAGTRTLAIVNAGGTGLREFRDALVRPDEWGAQWSDDGRTIAYQSPDLKSLYLLDIATGRSRALLANVQTGKFRWHSDGRSIIAYVFNVGMQQIGLDGQRTTVIPQGAVAGGGIRYIETTAAGIVARVDSTATLYPFGGGAERSLGTLPRNPLGTSARSRDGRYVAGFIRGSETDRLEIFSTDTWQHRVVDLSFKLRALGFDPAFANDNKSLVVMGYRATDSLHQVFSVPLDGGRPVVVGSVNATQPGASLSVSPDGKQVVYTSRRSFARNLVLLDFRSALKAAARTGNEQ